jgi:transcriptional regulator GlxA family with amidase domain
MLDQGLSPNAPRTADPRLAEAVDWLESLPFNQPWRERHLAEHVHLSVSQLNRLFVRDLNTTPLTMREHLRLEAAQQFLEEGHRSMKAIAYELGFSSPGNFSTWFRKHTASSPRQWQKGLTADTAAKK